MQESDGSNSSITATTTFRSCDGDCRTCENGFCGGMSYQPIIVFYCPDSTYREELDKLLKDFLEEEEQKYDPNINTKPPRKVKHKSRQPYKRMSRRGGHNRLFR